METVCNSVSNAVSHASQSLRDFIWGALSTLPRGPIEPTIITLTPALPLRLQLVAGMHAPLRLEKAVNAATLMNFVVTPDGTLYAPKYGSSDVLVFAFDGTPLPPLPLKALGLSTSTLSAAFVHDFVEDTGTLLLADANGAFSKLVAVDTASMTVCWSASMGISCYGIAVLPAQGVVVASDYSLDKLHARRLSDGAHIASVAAVNSTYTASTQPQPLFIQAPFVTFPSTVGTMKCWCLMELLKKLLKKLVLLTPLALLPWCRPPLALNLASAPPSSSWGHSVARPCTCSHCPTTALFTRTSLRR